MPKSCFVICPIGALGSETRAHADDLIKYIIGPVVKVAYGAPLRADTLPEPGRITTQVIRNLKDANLVIADLTGGNPNVYYELSLRHALGNPVIHMALDGTDLPFDVIDNRTIFFTMHSRHAEAAREELSKQILHVQTPDYRPSNPIIETLNVIELQSSALPFEQLVGNLVMKVEHLTANVAAMQSTLLRMPNETRGALFRADPYQPLLRRWSPSELTSGATTPLTLHETSKEKKE